ncbi:Rebeccamycin O-methyltransferase [Legionella busanensis]|uniref:Rebeccamycin O-methyltransferase n=1 Tax=Legionella busanensis TaxID=190655 RepID=A0A378JGS3_9GAMM|nr:class I SAM-dependent methyltransferase [Legionella busanensis]STX50197.1 Rebeccamycin O-methyltransferase [Legionella busanensis]
MSFPKLSTLEKKLVERIINLKPKAHSLLEVGCGDGKKLIYLKNKYFMKVYGIDLYEPYVEKLRQANISVEIGDARLLTYANDNFSWVLVANSLHHIPNPEDALAEALRVAKYGVIVVDPWYDKTIYSQQLSASLAAWCKKLHQSLGYFHREGLSAGEIINAITHEISGIEVYYELFINELNIEEFFKIQQQYITQLQENHYLLWELKQIKHRINNNFISEPGQVVVIIRK